VLESTLLLSNSKLLLFVFVSFAIVSERGPVQMIEGMDESKKIKLAAENKQTEAPSKTKSISKCRSI
jgi:hypothetical protein